MVNLTIEDLQGGTFTISNGGVYGSMLSTPISKSYHNLEYWECIILLKDQLQLMEKLKLDQLCT